MTPFILEWDITERDENKLIRDFLREQGISKTALTDIKYSGGSILINETNVNVRHLLVNGEKLKLVFPLEHVELMADNILLDIVYEDPYLLIINKKAGIQSIPSREKPRGSLANALIHYYQTIDLHTTVHLVNRLDKDTSGLLLVSKHRHIHHLFSEQQKSGTLKRRYEAIVQGRIVVDCGIIDAPIGRKDDSIIEREVRDDGQNAVTHFQVLNRLEQLTHVSLRLETGRTHQIRVHLSHLGHPIIGDDLYGGSRHLINRQALHCCELSFWHPIYKEKVSFQIELPDDMKELFK
ncbi:RluA family pseudouridine synthase [Fredinandcohnia quinoae]|uniref:Pseudouridine synthase n=1 Tax=Fredinandcohnia quinoae TaxID=2918902 RepID=A0AAW5EAQ9_9BACI|nr:RluA family pseudouridine synthase [Fredinandcohnia sp. SECRCQ15]